jgi:hypothetical protein
MFVLSFYDLMSRQDLTKSFETRTQALRFANDLGGRKCLVLILRLPGGSILGSNQLVGMMRELVV